MITKHDKNTEASRSQPAKKTQDDASSAPGTTHGVSDIRTGSGQAQQRQGEASKKQNHEPGKVSDKSAQGAGEKDAKAS